MSRDKREWYCDTILYDKLFNEKEPDEKLRELAVYDALLAMIRAIPELPMRNVRFANDVNYVVRFNDAEIHVVTRSGESQRSVWRAIVTALQRFLRGQLRADWPNGLHIREGMEYNIIYAAWQWSAYARLSIHEVDKT